MATMDEHPRPRRPRPPTIPIFTRNVPERPLFLPSDTTSPGIWQHSLPPQSIFNRLLTLSKSEQKIDFSKVTPRSKTRIKRMKKKASAQVNQIAGKLHEKWCRDRGYAPRLKTTADGKEIDIANLDFEDLPPKWQRENLAAAESVLDIMKSHPGIDTESAANLVHVGWLQRNRDWASPDQKKDYEDLSEKEKEKDRVVVRIARRCYP